MAIFNRPTGLYSNHLDQLSQKAVAAAEAVLDMVKNPANAEADAKRVSDIEHSADRIIRDTYTLQNQASGLSSNTGDLIALIEKVDDIVDVADMAAERLWLHQVPAATPESLELGELFVAASRLVKKLIDYYRAGRSAPEILEVTMEIDALEKKGDVVFRSAMVSLFSGKHDAMHVLRWKDVYERLERGVNKCEDVGKLVQALVQAMA